VDLLIVIPSIFFLARDRPTCPRRSGDAGRNRRTNRCATAPQRNCRTSQYQAGWTSMRWQRRSVLWQGSTHYPPLVCQGSLREIRDKSLLQVFVRGGLPEYW